MPAIGNGITSTTSEKEVAYFKMKSLLQQNMFAVALALCLRQATAEASPSPEGFGSPPPLPSQCSAIGPRVQCGAQCSFVPFQRPVPHQ